MMGMYCVDSIPPSHISSSKEIIVGFKTANWGDGHGPGNGFKMEYNPTGRHQFKTTLNNMKRKVRTGS